MQEETIAESPGGTSMAYEVSAILEASNVPLSLVAYIVVVPKVRLNLALLIEIHK